MSFFGKIIAVFKNETVHFIIGLVLVIFSVYLLLAFSSFFFTGAADQSIIDSGNAQELISTNNGVKNYAGSRGAQLASYLINDCFGVSSFFILIFLAVAGLKLMRVRVVRLWKWFIGCSLLLVWFSIFFGFVFVDQYKDSFLYLGGMHGYNVSNWLVSQVGVPGVWMILLITAIFFLIYLSTRTIIWLRKLFTFNFLKKEKKEIEEGETPEEFTESWIAKGKKESTIVEIPEVKNEKNDIEEAAEELLEDEGWTGERIRGDYDQLMEKVEEMDEVVMAEIQKSQGEYKPLAKVEELEEANYNMIDNVLNNMPPKKEPYLEYFATECDEFHDMGAYEKSTDVNQIAAVYEKYRENPKTAYLGCSMGIIYRDPEDSYYDEAEFAIVKGNTVFGNLMDDVRFYGELALVREGIEKIHEALPDYKYVPMRDVREAMYPEKMTTEQLAEALDEIAEAFDPYEYRDNVERGENTVQEVMLDLRSGNIHSYISYLKDIVDEECDLSVRAGVLIERLKAYEPELPKDMEPMVYVNYCEESDLMNPRCQKLSELDAKTAEMDKEWYAKRDPKTEEPTKIAKIYVTVYYAEKGEQMLHHFKKSMDIGNGHGGIVSQLKYDNEMKLTDEYWINYQKGKGSEEFQKYMEDLTDMQNHVLPYLQSFCNLEEKGVKERREQQIAERYEGRADERVTSTEANEVVKDVGKTDRKPAQQKQAVDGKDKKLSIHERLEINKRIIQEKQGKDKTERGVDLGVRTV